MKINPNDPVQGFVDYGFADENNKGITIRTQIAAMAMQGLLSNPAKIDTTNFIWLAQYAVGYADELINCLNETSNA